MSRKIIGVTAGTPISVDRIARELNGSLDYKKVERFAVTETAESVTITCHMKDGTRQTHVLNFDANGNPTSIVVDGVSIPGTWEVAANE